MLDHLHIIVVVAFSNAMRRLKGGVKLHCIPRLKMNKRSNFESACRCCALRHVSSFLNERFKPAKTVTWRHAIWQNGTLQTAESKPAILTRSFRSKSRADPLPKNVDAQTTQLRSRPQHLRP